MKASRIALSIVALPLIVSAVSCQSPCVPNVQRQLEVTNNSSADIWIGGGGGALRAICVVSPTETCIPPDGHYRPDGTCDCGNGKFDSTLACPGISSPKLGYAEGGKECGCYQDSDCGPGAGCNSGRHLCFYQLPDPVSSGFTPKPDPWQVPPGGTVNFCLDEGSVSYPTPATAPSPTPVPSQNRKRPHAVIALAPTATPTLASIPSAVWWSGGVFARTGCNPDGTQCATGDCPGAAANSDCPAGSGAKNPATIAEFTLQRNANDFYDITIINGANIAEQMAPIPTVTPTPGEVTSQYWCAAPGATCNWNFGPYIAAVPVLPTPTPTPRASLMSLSVDAAEAEDGAQPAAEATYATLDYTSLLTNSVYQCNTQSNPDGCPAPLSCSGANGRCYKKCTSDADCASDAKGAANLHCLPGGNPVNGTMNKYCQCAEAGDCPGNQVCGMQQIPGVPPGETYLQVCGDFRGWWTVDDLCGNPANHVGPFDCSATILDGDFSSTTNLSALLGCNAYGEAKSCYQTGAGATCCGCGTKAENPLHNLWPPENPNEQCVGNNPTWAAVAQPLLANLKQGCPTAYTYPYDDATSTFQCRADNPVNTLGYKITFGDLVVPPKRLQ